MTLQDIITYFHEHLEVADIDALEVTEHQRLNNLLLHWSSVTERRLFERRPAPPTNPHESPWWMHREARHG